MVEEKFVNAHGFIGDGKIVGTVRPNPTEEGSTLQVTQQTKPRNYITDAMIMLVRAINCRSVNYQATHRLTVRNLTCTRRETST